MTVKNKCVLYWEGSPHTITEYVDLRKIIKDFKSDQAMPILQRYYDKEGFRYKGDRDRYERFKPKLDENRELENENAKEQRVGIFSTAACLETVGGKN